MSTTEESIRSEAEIEPWIVIDGITYRQDETINNTIVDRHDPRIISLWPWLLRLAESLGSTSEWYDQLGKWVRQTLLPRRDSETT